MRVLHSPSVDVFFNLALEDVLLDQVEADGPALLLWRAGPAVVIGKNQNPWRECDLRTMSAEGGRLARRISGGGAVYHDLGNLNYAWFSPRADYRTDAVFSVVIRALRDLGVPAERQGRSSLAAARRKFSGTAFCYRKNAVLHHGTLLVDADLDRLHRWLDSPCTEMETRAIASEPAPVGNLGPFGISGTDLRESLVVAFSRFSGAAPVEAVIDEPAMAKRRATLSAWEWVIGHTPRFTCRVGEVEVTVEKGCISAVSDPGLHWHVGARFTPPGSAIS